MMAASDGLQPPAAFAFPYTPYAIQQQFMAALYRSVEKGGLCIMESPTGTVRPIAH